LKSSRLHNKVIHSVFVKKLTATLRKISLPGFEGMHLYEVGDFFLQRLKEGELQTRARAIAFSFFLALFPTIIFIFTLIPYIPIPAFPEKLLLLIKEFLPSSTYEAAKGTIEDIVLHQRGGLLSFGFIFAIFVSSDGVLALMSWFNRSYHGKDQRKGWKKRIMAIVLTLTLSLFVFTAIGLLITSEIIFSYLEKKEILVHLAQVILLLLGKWTVLLLLCFSAISLLYYFGPSKHEKVKFISAGSSLATMLIIVTTLGFNYFINNFGQYNKIYGSIGTLIVILIWLYINLLVILVGYELNVSIRKARKITSLPIG
jgi:membrane protein